MTSPQLTIGQTATLACLLEASAPKPGNVHRGADFADMTFYDFAVSAALIGPAMENSHQTGPGLAALAAVQATRAWIHCNTNLGTILLLSPLAAAAGAGFASASAGKNLPGAIPRRRRENIADYLPLVLESLTAQDAAHVYEAIRQAAPGGLGQVPEADVTATPPADLRYAMGLAADRDLVARQYVNGFADVLQFVVPSLRRAIGGNGSNTPGLSVPRAIVHTAVELMHAIPDSLIARKCGVEVAAKSAHLAGQVLATGPPDGEEYQRALADLDFWLRSDGNRRNPGTTADLIAAGLFVALWEGDIQPPLRW